jgi:PAS domain S-box-containing protein
MPSTDTTLKNTPNLKIHQHRISLVVGMILTAVTVVVGVTVFIVMQRHAQELLSKSLQLSLQNRVQLIAAEIGSGFDRTLDIAALPQLINQLQRVNADQDARNARLILDAAAQSFLSTGLTAIAMRDKDGREVAHAGPFAQTPALSVPLGLPGRVHLIWDGQLFLHVVLDIKQAGIVVGQVIAERALPDTMSAFKEANFVGETGEFALCASFGLNMQCFPTALNPAIFTVPKRSPQGVLFPIAHALEGKAGVITGFDYRKQDVVAAYAPVDNLGLGVVLKMDSAELFAPVWMQLRYLIPLLVGVLAIALLLVRWRLTPLVAGLVRSEAQAKKMSASLRDSESRARALLDNVDDGIVSISDSGMIELFNPAAERMFGYRSEDVVGKHLSTLMPDSYPRAQDDDFGRYLQAGQAKIIGSGREVAGRRSDGGIFPMDLRIAEFFLGGRRQFIGSIRDITERKRSIEALRASELQLRQITDAIPTLIAYMDTEQRFRFHNKAYEELVGLSFEQINGRTLIEVIGPSVYKFLQDKVEEVLQGHAVRYERVHMTKQGDERVYAMHFFPRYGEGTDKGKVLGFFATGTDVTELKRIDRMKTEFISTVSHELRTPLTSIRGSLGLIDGGVAGEVPKAVKNLVGIAKSNCERLIRLINDILDSEKIESGKVRLDLKPVDIRQMVRQTMAAMDGFAVQHGVKLRFQAPDAPLTVHIDSDRLIQVLTNLLSNALKFSPPQSTVEVNVLRVARQVRVEVADHGPGIPAEFRGRIFQKFSQADSSDSRQKGGSGLGLNISKALIEKMGGQIGFSSEAGVGTTFFIELPEWQNPTAPVRVQSVLSRPRVPVFEGEDDSDMASLESGKPRILHIEDDPDIQRIVDAIAGGFADFEFAANVDEARAQLRERRFDLVLLDPDLGNGSGWGLCEDIDALDPPPLVIVFSASDVDPAECPQAEAVLVKARTSNTELLNTILRVLQISGDPGPTRPQPLS